MNLFSHYWFLFIFILSPSFVEAKVKYNLHSGASWKLRQKYVVVAHTSIRRTGWHKRGDKLLGDVRRTRQYRYKAIITIQRLNKVKTPSYESQRVIYFKRKFGNRWLDVLPRGTIIFGLMKNRKKVFLVNGYPLNKTNALMPYSVSTLSRVDAMTYEELYGQKKLRSIGERWKMDPKAGLRSLRKQLNWIIPRRVYGYIKLSRIVYRNKIPYLQINYRSGIPSFDLRLYKGYKKKRQRMTVRSVFYMPLRRKERNHISYKTKFYFHFKASKPSNIGMEPLRVNLKASVQTSVSVRSWRP